MNSPETMESVKEKAKVETKRKPRRWRRWLKRFLLSVLVLVILLVFGVLPYLLARLVTNASTRPADRRLTATPADYQIQFSEVEFQTSDGVTISGWLIPPRGKDATIVYSHGLFRSRHELLDRAVELSRLGYGGLLYDQRNHGKSGKARTSLGYFERLDALAAISFLRESARFNGRIILFGISMGATAALLASAESNDVACVISDSAFPSLKETIDHHVRLFFRLPAFPLANEIQFFIEQRAGFDGSQLNAVEAVKKMGERPALFISGARDRRIPPDVARRLYEASSSPKRDLLIVDAPETEVHGRAYEADPENYIKTVTGFIQATPD